MSDIVRHYSIIDKYFVSFTPGSAGKVDLGFPGLLAKKFSSCPCFAGTSQILIIADKGHDSNQAPGYRQKTSKGPQNPSSDDYRPPDRS